MAKKSSKGVFCLEAEWWGVKDTTTVEPVLQLLRSVAWLAVPYIHRNAATRGEFEHYIQKWTNRGLQKYPILYLGFHGEPGLLRVGEGRGGRTRLTLDELAELLAGKCKGKVIHFGSCSTLDTHGHKLNAFLRHTEALALLGFRGDTEWVEAAAFELLLLGEIQRVSLTKRGMKALARRIRQQAPDLSRRLGFRMVM